MTFDSHLNRIFGEDKLSQFQKSKVLLVGAGGIGCELLKDLIMMNYGEIHIVDLDTIDLSNLNRQFLFRQSDIKKSKSVTAVAAVEHFNHFSKLISYHGDIMNTNLFPLSWFKGFNIIFNALDNLEARVYVNNIALFTKTTLMESGTTGLKGQVQPIYPYQTECFQCLPKETPKSFPVCTIRSTPSKTIHCVTWAKNFLFLQLFGEDSEIEREVTNEDSNNEQELDALNKESNELKELKDLVKSNSQNFDPSKEDYILEIIDKIFRDDIERLLSIDELWESRSKPTPLDYKTHFGVIDENRSKYDELIKDDQKIWDLKEDLYMFLDSTKRLTKRYVNENSNIIFDKDDKDTLDFVVSASNIRSVLFDIPSKSKFDIKQMAGNIIPAVASTNAIIAGFSALQSINHYTSDPVANSRMVYDSEYTNKFMAPLNLTKGHLNCPACSLPRGVIDLNLKTTTISKLRDAIMTKFSQEYEDDISVIAGRGSRLLYDYDFEDNLERSLESLGIVNNDIVMILDSEDVYKPLELYVQSIDTDDDKIVIPEGLTMRKKPAPPATDDEKLGEEENENWEINGDGVIEFADDEDQINLDDDEMIILEEQDVSMVDEKKRKADEVLLDEEYKKIKLSS